MAAKTLSNPVVAAPGKGIGFGFGPRNTGDVWILHETIVDRAGTVVSRNGNFPIGYFSSRCPGTFPPPPAPPSSEKLAACLQRLGIHTVTAYQPAGRFWAFQGIETAVYLALAVGLLAVAAWIVRRKLA
jgi:hypothetical protein